MRTRHIGRACARLAWPPIVGALWFAGIATWHGTETAVLAAAVALGLVLGLAADVLLRRRARRARPSPLRALLVVLVLHGLLLAWAMADTPQVYSASFYAQGGLLRAIQLLCTDVLGPHGVLALGVVLALAFVRPRVRPLLYHIRRFKMTAPAALVLAGAGHEAAPPPVDGPPNVLVLAASSFRADRLDPRVTPRLARLAAASTRFDRAYVSLPSALPSWVTLLTGRHAHHHGIRSMFPTWEERTRDLDALPARLARAGYRTAVVSDDASEVFGRIDLGFQQVAAPSAGLGPIFRRALFPPAREVVGDPALVAREAIDRLVDAPFFLAVSFSAARAPYAVPAPYYRAFTRPSYRGRFKYDAPFGREKTPPDAADLAQIQGLRDGARRGIDDAIGQILAALEARHLDRRTIVVVTGEEGESGGTLVGDDATHVPLVIHDPRAPAHGVSSQIVRDVDLAPTLLDLVGRVPGDTDGRSLAPALRSEPLAPRFAYAETDLWRAEDVPGVGPDLRIPYPALEALTEIDPAHDGAIVLRRAMIAPTLLARHRMIRDERWKLVYAPTRAGVRYLLFDTARDPGETTDVAAEEPAEVARLRAELWRWMLEDPAMEPRDGYLVPRHGAIPR